MCIQVQTGIHEYDGSNTFLCPSSITHMMSTPPAAADVTLLKTHILKMGSS